MTTSNHRLAAVAAGAAILVGFGSFGAVASGMITSDDIKNHEVKAADIARDAVGSGKIEDGSLKLRDLDPATVNELQGPSYAGDAPRGEKGEKGDTGPAGPAGAKGDKGDAGKNGVSGYEVRSWDYDLVSGGGIATMTCPVGKVALGGGYWLKDEGVMTNGTTVIRSMPGRMDWNGADDIDNTEDDNTLVEDGRGWIVQVNKPSNVNPGAMTVYVTCAAMAAAPAS